jgi:hypothetical protein
MKIIYFSIICYFLIGCSTNDTPRVRVFSTTEVNNSILEITKKYSEGKYRKGIRISKESMNDYPDIKIFSSMEKLLNIATMKSVEIVIGNIIPQYYVTRVSEFLTKKGDSFLSYKARNSLNKFVYDYSRKYFPLKFSTNVVEKMFFKQFKLFKTNVGKSSPSIKLYIKLINLKRNYYQSKILSDDFSLQDAKKYIQTVKKINLLFRYKDLNLKNSYSLIKKKYPTFF